MNYHNISYPDMNNGGGLRVCLWLSSCSHHCPKCQNPQTWDCNSGIPFDKAAHDELFEQLSKDYISGVTFTGGDPLHENNLSGVLDLVNEIKHSYPEKTIWLYTGYTWEEIWESKTEKFKYFKNRILRWEIISMCDVMVDGRYVDELRDISLAWRGSSNQRVINVKESLKQERLVLYCD
ncbi:anaerobic ribonucleoside-triphosphate reductase activating protein [Lacrimispora indolis]|uniref:anaerobic ribonucleoside-triphosphate reductase activating protein n=1 Tax=Lacrimispora indolis TaxID=69825 RepID=UPI00046279EE|nr:anaerobic ribonucleoside-triphosphate reductase activating protein [[Clostridium] methoxybenzovorans]